MKNEKRKKLSTEEIGAINNDIIQKHGEGASQILQALKGERYDSLGNDIGHRGRSLEEISNYKINDKYRETNIKQQSGFSAELIKESRDNSEAIKNGNKIRTRTTDGIGETNNQKHDHYKIDEFGNITEGSQMKFYSSPEDLIKKLSDKKWSKYADSPIDVPTEQVEEIKRIAREKAEKLRTQAEMAKSKGDTFLYEKKLDEAKALENIEKNVRDSGVTREEAVEARVSPNKFVAKEVLKESHVAGKSAAKGAVILSGAISFGQNAYLVMNGEKELDEACCDVAKDVALAGGTAYIIAGTGTVLKGFMHSSGKEILRRVGTTNAPALIVTGTLEIAKSLKKYAVGEINETELLEELGKKGTGMIAASYGATVGGIIGTAILPGVGTTVGAIVGSMVGYSVSNLIYDECLNVLKRRDISMERRRIIEEISVEAIKKLEIYRKILIEENNMVLNERDLIIENISVSIKNSNLDMLTESINRLGKSFKKNLQFQNFEEFDDVMNDENINIIL